MANFTLKNSVAILPRVTEILRATESKADKDRLRKWQPVPDYEGIYEVSNIGEVRSKTKELRPIKVGKYLKVALYKNGERKDVLISRLVASAFIGPCPDGLVIDHVDANPLNNTPENLEYVTHQENMRRAMEKGLVRKSAQVQLTAFGKTQHINAWAREFEIKTDTLHKRLSYGWSIEKSLTTPAHYNRHHA